MIKEKLLYNYHTAKNSILLSKSPANNSRINTIADTIIIKDIPVKLNLPVTNSTVKLQQLNDRIQRIDPQKKAPKVVNKIIKVINVDTTTVALFDEDTIPYVKHLNRQNYFQKENFYYNIPDYKPFHKLIDSTIIRKDTIKNTGTTKEAEKEIYQLHKSVYKQNKSDYREHFSASWIPGFLIIIFLLLAWIRVFYNKILKLTLRGAFNALISNRLFREKNIFAFWGNNFLNILFFITGGFFLYLFFIYSGYRIMNINDISTSLIFMAGLLIIYTGKILFVQLIGVIFKDSESIAEYLHNVLLYNKTLGIILIPFVVVIPYVPEPGTKILLYTGIVVLILFYFLRLLRGLRIGFKLNISIFYLILYLCTLEFFPVLILYKIFINYTS